MKRFSTVALMWALFVAAIALFYVSMTVVFPTTLFNVVSFFTALVCLVQGARQIDKEHHFGAFSGTTSTTATTKVEEEDEETAK